MLGNTYLTGYLMLRHTRTVLVRVLLTTPSPAEHAHSNGLSVSWHVPLHSAFDLTNARLNALVSFRYWQSARYKSVCLLKMAQVLHHSA